MSTNLGLLVTKERLFGRKILQKFRNLEDPTTNKKDTFKTLEFITVKSRLHCVERKKNCPIKKIQNYYPLTMRYLYKSD